jgi:hypothetical protein
LERLEPDIRERISPVLRGGADGNAAPLPDAMKLTVMGQMTKGMQKVEARELLNDVEKQLIYPRQSRGFVYEPPKAV